VVTIGLNLNLRENRDMTPISNDNSQQKPTIDTTSKHNVEVAMQLRSAQRSAGHARALPPPQIATFVAVPNTCMKQCMKGQLLND
jgi:hypothetical protein